MEDNDIFPPWGDLDDGKPSVWAADWIIDENQALEEIFVTIVYDHKEEFILKYNEVKEAFDNNTIKELLSNYITEEIKTKDVQELKDFFFHWLMIVGKGGNLDLTYDDLVDERDDDFIESENKTIH